MADRVFTYNINYEPEAISLFSRMSSQPSISRKNLINEIISQLKINSIWNELDGLWFLAGADSQAAKLNWKTASYDLTELGTMNFIADRGYTRNGVAGGTTDALNTNFTPSTNGVKFTRNSNSFGIYVRSSIQEAQVDFGGVVGNLGIQLNCQSNSTQGAARNNHTTAFVFNTPTSNSQGLTTITRPNSTTMNYYKNGSFISNTTLSTTGDATVPLYICAYNVSNAVSAGSSKQIAFAYVGSGNIDQSILYNLVQFYMTNIGAAV